MPLLSLFTIICSISPPQAGIRTLSLSRIHSYKVECKGEITNIDGHVRHTLPQIWDCHAITSHIPPRTSVTIPLTMARSRPRILRAIASFLYILDMLPFFFSE